jgi:class 3 adenylate cyclase
MTAVGDPIHLASRLIHEAATNEIIVSNSCYHLLEETDQDMFEEAPPVEARSVGRIKAWRYRPRRASDFSGRDD